MPPRNLLLATDLSSRCDRALDRAVSLAHAWGARLHVLHAMPPAADVDATPAWRRTADPKQDAMRRVRNDLRSAGAVDFEVRLERGDPAEAILAAVAATRSELVVTGIARDEELGRSALGETVEKLVRRSAVPLLVVKARPRAPYRDVVVACDTSDGSRLAYATSAALFTEARHTLFYACEVAFEEHVGDKAAARDNAARQGEAELRAFAAGLPAHLQDAALACECGEPDRLLRDLALSGRHDLVALGTRGRGKLARTVFGNTAERILRASPIDVLVVRQPADET